MPLLLLGVVLHPLLQLLDSVVAWLHRPLGGHFSRGFNPLDDREWEGCGGVGVFKSLLLFFFQGCQGRGGVALHSVLQGGSNPQLILTIFLLYF